MFVNAQYLIFEQMLNRAFITLCIFCFTQQFAAAQVLGVPLHSWDFSGGLPTTWSNGSTSGIGIWEYRGPATTPSNAITSRGSCSGGSSAFNSVTQSNGFMIFDSNYWDDNDNECGGFGTGLDPGPHTSWLISNQFSLTGVTGAVVTYQQQFRNFGATIKVQYSINSGTTWVDMSTQVDFPSASAEWKSATFPAGATGQTNVRLRFLFSGNYYHWAIDDITVYKPSINNLAINNTRYTTFGNTSPVPPNDFHDLPYDRYPKTMIVPFKFNAKATNIGSATQTNTNLNVKVLNAVNTTLYNQTTANVSVVAGAIGNYTLTAGFTPTTTTGYFRIVYQINQLQTDEAPTNNRDTLDYFITDYQYARDEGPMQDEFTPNALYGGQKYQVGNIFEGHNNTVKCTSVAVAVGPGTAVGTTIQAKIYRSDFSNLVATSVQYPVNAWDINTLGQEKLITLQLPTALTLSNDSVYIVMVGNTVGSQAFRVCRSGSAIDQTSFVQYPESNGLFFMAKMPVVRMNLFTLAQIPGCTNPLAMNFAPTALLDDGSCDLPGCIYPASSNYNANANWYDGSCIVSGCTIPTACNYSPIATVNNGSCVLPITYYSDSDTDGFGDLNTPLSACTPPIGYVTNSTDCNDNNFAINPNGIEICNTTDDDCDGIINEGFTFLTYYADADADGFGNPSVSLIACSIPAGYVSNNGDCNDANPLIKPGAAEVCNLIDDNCNGQINEGLVFVNYYLDADLDAFGAGAPINSCTPVVGNYVTINLDCNDNNANIRPNALEICNSIDDNCNNLIDDGLTFLNYYADSDSDGFGAGNPINSCSNVGAGFVTNNHDCNDSNPAIRPTASEICNGIDDNCNAETDEGLPYSFYYLDADQDGFYTSSVFACISPGANYYLTSSSLGDCNDNNGSINSAAIEICGNNIDENCDGSDLTCIVPGCTNPVAANFNPSANQDDESCIILGCIDPNADNFNPAANTSNSSCMYMGCTDPEANNYDPNANTGDFSCEYNVASISVSSTQLCQFQNLIAYNQTLFSASDSCVIDFGDGTILNYCSSEYEHNYNDPGTFQIHFNYFQGVETSSAITEPITVSALPQAATLALNYPLITASYNTADSFDWFFNNDFYSSNEATIDASQDYQTEGYFSVQTTNEFGCVSSSNSIYFVVPTYSIEQSNPCGPNQVHFTNTTQSSENLDCHFENSNIPGSIFNSPYTYSMDAPEIFTMTQVCYGFGNTYYSLQNSFIESFEIPEAPTIEYASNVLTLSNNISYSTQWFLNGTALDFTENSNSVNCFFNNNFQNGNYAAIYTSEFGCISDTTYYFVLEINATSSAQEGCFPFTTTFLNNTTMPLGIQCEILIPGLDYVSFDDSFEYTFNEPGLYIPSVYCYLGANTATYTLETITVFNHPEAPQISWTFGEVSAENNAASHTVNWSLDNLNLPNTTNLVSTLINGVYENGYYMASYTDSNGCSSEASSVLVIQPQFEVTLAEGCGPLQTEIINTTDYVEGMSCVVQSEIGGLSFPIDNSFGFNYDTPGYYSPILTCSVGPVSGTYTLEALYVYPNPNSVSISAYSDTLEILNLGNESTVSWLKDNVILNLSTNPLSLINSQYNGYFQAVVTNEFGCSTTTDSILFLTPSFVVSETQGCSPLVLQVTNTTPSYPGVVCIFSTAETDYSLNATEAINYSADGLYTTELTCSVGSQFYSTFGPDVSVFARPSAPIISSVYGAILCSNCSGLSTQYFLDGSLFTTGSNAVSTLQNGGYQNGNYSAQSTNSLGCISEFSSQLLVIQPALNFTPTEGCAPLPTTFVNVTDPINGLYCELFLGNGIGNIPISYLEFYDFNYTTANEYNPFLTCTLSGITGNSPTTTILVNGGTTPVLIFENNTVFCSNCAIEDNTSWLIDGTIQVNSLVSVPDSLGDFFTCTYVDEFGCSASSFVVSISKIQNNPFGLFPNPSQELVTVTGLHSSSTLEIRDNNGRLIWREFGLGEKRILNVLNFANGMYTLTEISHQIVRSGTLLVNH